MRVSLISSFNPWVNVKYYRNNTQQKLATTQKIIDTTDAVYGYFLLSINKSTLQYEVYVLGFPVCSADGTDSGW